MQCTMAGGPGRYEARKTVVVERVQSQLMVSEQVPVAVCDVCGDGLLHPETVRHVEALRHTATATTPQRMVPLDAYVCTACPVPRGPTAGARRAGTGRDGSKGAPV